jgi:hypothetical protein
MSFAKRRPIFIAAAAALVALLATGVAYAEGVFADPDLGPVVRATAGATPVAGYPGWSYAAATSAEGTACIVLTTPFGHGRTCAEPGADAGMLSAGFVVDEATGTRYGFVMGFARPDEQTLAAFSDGTTRVNLSSPEGVYFVAVTPDDIKRGVLPVSVAGATGTQLASDLPREAFEAGVSQS